jgi:hypothetical protein
VLPDRAPQGTNVPPRKLSGPEKKARSRLRERPRAAFATE